MEDNIFAELNPKQIEKLNEMEEKFGVTLIAYNTAEIFDPKSVEIIPSS